MYEAATGRVPDMMRACLLAVIIQMLAVHGMAEAGYLRLGGLPNFGVVTAIAGFIYGIGMVLSMGCAGAVFYRAGEGRLDYLIVTAAFAVGAWFANNHLAVPLRGNAISPLVADGFSGYRWWFIVPAACGGLLWIMRGKRRPYEGGWDWSFTGVCISLIGIAAWTLSAKTGKPYGLGTMHGSDGIATLLLEWNRSELDWSAFLVIGIPIGSFIASRLFGASVTRPLKSSRIPLAILGGLLMGIAAAVAVGDNMLHGLSGIPMLATSSFIFMLCAFLGVWLGIRLRWLK